jgi:hypothetical protein
VQDFRRRTLDGTFARSGHDLFILSHEWKKFQERAQSFTLFNLSRQVITCPQ